jgi:hypothetical protein
MEQPIGTKKEATVPNPPVLAGNRNGCPRDLNDIDHKLQEYYSQNQRLVLLDWNPSMTMKQVSALPYLSIDKQ